ncbi:BUD13 homolog [Corticium candelabrum]|uniref:BUD13 homolog n=1 Tax=Corticium candelabrum TaxID=121492 RepID=UPI002E27345A|nr:BUD13 homolog [Corticium candelabrum]
MTSKAEYLKRYISGSVDDKRAKKKKKSKVKIPVRQPKTKIVDDDVDWREIAPEIKSEDEEEFVPDEEGQPQVVEVLDEQKIAAEKMKWRQIEKQRETLEGENSDDSFDDRQRHDSDESPPRKTDNSSKSQKERHDSDESPPRRQTAQKSDSDESPPRRTDKIQKSYRERYDSDESPPRRQFEHKSDSDESPPRRRNKEDSDDSHRRSTRQNISDKSPTRNKSRNDSDESPPRRRKRNESDESLPRKSKWDSDVSSVKRKQRYEAKRRSSQGSSDRSPSSTKRRDEDLSQRRMRKKDSEELATRQKGSRVDDLGSKARQQNQSEQKMRSYSGKRQSPARRRHDSDDSPPRKVRRDQRFDDEHTNSQRTSTERSELGDKDQHKSTKHEITQDANDSRRTKSGLQTSAVLREENRLAKEREKEMFDKMDRGMSGRGADTVFRDKEGRRIDPKLEKIKQRQAEEEQARHEEKYKRWGKGIAQQQMKEQEVEDMIHEMNKPLARYKDDEDLDKMLREKERSGDPMLEFVRKRKEKREEGNKKPERPIFKGSFPPNRFNIRPGYRWDSVDRSNGYEKDRFLRISGREAWKEEAYKWSVEEM